MKRYILPVFVLLLTLGSCIVIEEDPLVTVDPTVSFQSHVRGDKVYVTATVLANPAYLSPGNIPTLFEYEGEISLYNEITGELLASETIGGKGLSAITEVSVSSDDFLKIIVVASGKVSVYADKGTDGDPANDLFILDADFYQMSLLTDIISLQDFPVVTLAPEVEYFTYFMGTELYTTATVTANPTFLNTGTYPLNFAFTGVIQIYNQATGALLKSSNISGTGLSTNVTILIDAAPYRGLIIVTSGTVTCTGDIGADGDASNDVLVSSSKYYGLLEVDLVEEVVE